MIYPNTDTEKIINVLSAERIPFIFIIDFDCRRPIVIPISEINNDELLFDFNGFTNWEERGIIPTKKVIEEVTPPEFEYFKNAFDTVRKYQAEGDSYLANLTLPSKIKINCSLKDIFKMSKAKYKLWYKDKFVVFSPEIFIRIEGNIISSCPMKGTIDAGIPNAAELIMRNEKELAEHITIVDLIRNDIGIIANNVRVEKFRYIDLIKAGDKSLLQVSSKIVGNLPEGFHKHLGDILIRLLPAGSITGAPKKKTVEIIKEAEKYERGYYTGVCGYFDGSSLDSGVMIRFIEKIYDDYFFKSGGGITIYSDIDSEYQELKDKIYVPIY